VRGLPRTTAGRLCSPHSLRTVGTGVPGGMPRHCAGAV